MLLVEPASAALPSIPVTVNGVTFPCAADGLPVPASPPQRKSKRGNSSPFKPAAGAMIDASPDVSQEDKRRNKKSDVPKAGAETVSGSVEMETNSPQPRK